jgi:molybdate transport system substrate-binding protein
MKLPIEYAIFNICQLSLIISGKKEYGQHIYFEGKETPFKPGQMILELILVLLMLSIPLSVFAQDKISVAVAANFIQTFQELVHDFEAKSSIKVESTFSSTGNLYSQVKNGAPYDLFLSADEERPAILKKDGLADQPFVYARGQVILWSPKKDFCKSATWQEALKNDQIKKIAIANPLTAPYGTAAKTAIQKAGLWDPLQSKLVSAQDIAQSFQYANTSAVDAGFCSMSATASSQGKNGCFFIITQAPDIIQSACILKRTKNRAAVEQFTEFLVSPAAQKINMKFGYR